MTDSYDVVVVGGGAAGLNGALMLARSLRSVLVVDAGAPRNAPADGVHGLLGREGMSPVELLERGRAEVRGYGGVVVTGEVVGVRAGGAVDVGRDGDEAAVGRGDGLAFVVALADGRQVHARRLLVTTGLVDELPDVAGLRERWGRDVIHCPYCHGYEHRGQPLAVLATGPMSVHQALLFSQLSDDVMYFAHRQPAPAGDAADQLAARGVSVVQGEVAGLEIKEDQITGVRLQSGPVIPRRVVAVATRMVARAGFLSELGLKPVAHPSGMGEHLPADPMGRSEAPGVWLAGNITDLSAQVGGAAAAGAMAGAQINMDLLTEDTQRAMKARR